MPRPKTKDELLDAAESQFSKLWQQIEAMPDAALNTEFDFSRDLKKKEAHWQRDKNLRDVLIHLHEWQLLLLRWVESNMAGIESPFLPPPYNWKTYGELNVEFWKRHQKTSLKEAEASLRGSHVAVIALVSKFSNEALFTKGNFAWTGGSTLGSYCVSTLSSHYDWAVKKLRAHAKMTATS